MSSQVKSWLLLGVIFIVGVVTGAALAIGLAPRFEPQPGARQMRQLWMADLVQRLNLTADQQTKVRPILAEAESRIRNLHQEEVERGARIIKETNDQISAILTPTQNAELQKMEAEREKKFEEHLRQRGFPHGLDGGQPDEMHPHNGPGDGAMPPPPPPPPRAPATNAAPSNA
jgi:Spy/CpxP family protein refolding chaperone